MFSSTTFVQGGEYFEQMFICNTVGNLIRRPRKLITFLHGERLVDVFEADRVVQSHSCLNNLVFHICKAFHVFLNVSYSYLIKDEPSPTEGLLGAAYLKEEFLWKITN
jgi:hypothetical protein